MSERGRNKGYHANLPPCLERLQRIYCDVDDEPCDFNEQSLAATLRHIAAYDVDCIEASELLLGIAAALDTDEYDWSLKLKWRKKGRFVPPNEATSRFWRDVGIDDYVNRLTKEGLKAESAVAFACEAFGLSRASIFAARKRAEGFKNILKAMPK